MDVSKPMLDFAKENFRKWNLDIDIDLLTSDFEQLNFKEMFMLHRLNEKRNRNFIFFLGNTICNFSEPAKFLSKISDAMFDDDVLFLGLALGSSVNRADLAYVKKPYNIEKEWSWVYTSLGFDFDDFEIDFRYDEKLSSKIKLFRLKKAYEILLSISLDSLSIDLPKGTEILRWQHYLFEIEDLIPILQANKLELKLLKTDPTQSNAILVCTKAKG